MVNGAICFLCFQNFLDVRVQYLVLVSRVWEKKNYLIVPALFFFWGSWVNPRSLQTQLLGTWGLSQYSRPINSICSGDNRFVSWAVFSLRNLPFVLLWHHLVEKNKKHLLWYIFIKGYSARLQISPYFMKLLKRLISLCVCWSGNMTKLESFLSKPFKKDKQSVWVGKRCLPFSKISFRSRDIQVFKICKLARWWRHTLNQILIKYDGKRYLGRLVSEMFDSLQ